MIGSSTITQVFKYGFITLVVSCAGYLIASITVVKHLRGESIDDLVYKPQISQTSEGATSTLDKGFEKCIRRPSATFCLMSAEKRLALLRSTIMDDPQHAVSIESNMSSHHQHPITTVLQHFSRVTRQMGVKPVLLEPSMLFCLLSPDNKVFLLTQKFNPGQLQGSRKVVTLGVREEESKLFDLEEALNASLASGFQFSRVRRWIKGSTFGEEPSRPDGFYTTHYFFTRQSTTVHLVVFFGQKNYLWHEDMKDEVWGTKDLLYLNAAAYDHFKPIKLETNDDLDMELYLPSDLVGFMLQIENSELRDCSRNASETFHVHPSLTEAQLKNRILIVINELKASFQPHFVPFWLWAKSLIGWYEKCNVFHITSELNFAVPYTKLRRLNLSTTFEYLKVVQHSSIDDKDTEFVLDCYGLRVNMFVAYEDGNSVRFYEDFEGNEQQHGLVYPKFKLCTTDVFGQKIQVPCKTEAILNSVPLQK